MKNKKISSINLFRPVIIDIFKKGYSFDSLKRDLIAGINIAITALPVAITIAIACGAAPKNGIFATIIGGTIAALLGGTRFLITAPTAVFLLVSINIVRLYGLDGLYLATMISGLFLIGSGLFRIGKFIDYIPYSAILGFTAGLACVMITIQLKEVLGLTVTYSSEQTSANQVLIHWKYYFTHLKSIDMPTLFVSLITAIPVLFFRRVIKTKFPIFLISLCIITVVVYYLEISVTTVGSKYGNLAFAWPGISMPKWSIQKIVMLIPDAITLALLGGINALLGATVTREMTNKPHKPDLELIAQGIANISVGLIKGLPITAGISRSITNIKLYAKSPMASIFQAIFVFVAAKFFADFVEIIPLASLHAVLLVMVFDMVKWDRFFRHCYISKEEALVLLTTFFITIFIDIAVAILSGTVLSSLIFMRRMGKKTWITSEIRTIKYSKEEIPEEISIYHIDGPFFFGAASRLKMILDQNKPNERIAILNLENVPLFDSTGTWVLIKFIKSCNKRGVVLILTNLSKKALTFFKQVGLSKKSGYVTAKSLDEGIDLACRMLEKM